MWGKPKCPIDPEATRCVEEPTGRLAVEFADNRGPGPVILPTDDFVPGVRASDGGGRVPGVRRADDERPTVYFGLGAARRRESRACLTGELSAGG